MMDGQPEPGLVARLDLGDGRDRAQRALDVAALRLVDGRVGAVDGRSDVAGEECPPEQPTGLLDVPAAGHHRRDVRQVKLAAAGPVQSRAGGVREFRGGRAVALLQPLPCQPEQVEGPRQAQRHLRQGRQPGIEIAAVRSGAGQRD